MAEVSVQENNINKIKEGVLAKHRVTRVLPRTQFELREQEENLADLVIHETAKAIFDEISKILIDNEQKTRIQELRQKYGLK